MFNNARITLITPNEVKKYSPADIHDSTSVRENFIITKEEKLFNLAFGWEFYESLIADKIDYDSSANYKGDYDSTENYQVGEVVQFVDELFQAKIATQGVSPKNKINWERAPKFNNNDYNYIWERYLRQILAFNVLHTSVLFSALKVQASGMTKAKGENFDSASLQEVQNYKKDLYGDIEDICYSMDLFMQRNKDKFPLYKPILDQKEGCEVKRKQNYNFGFNLGGSKYAYKPNAEDLDHT